MVGTVGIRAAFPLPKWWGLIMSRVVTVMACGFTLAACSTSMPSLNFLSSAPRTEAFRIESEPPGAEAKTSLGQSCRTPCELTIQPGSEFSVTLALNGYQPQTVSVRPEVSPQAAAPRLAPNPVYAELQPAAAPRKPLKKKKPIATATRPAASSPVASAAPPAPAPAAAVPTPPPSSEPAASATNYPWPSR
jgi:PEGA domain